MGAKGRERRRQKRKEGKGKAREGVEGKGQVAIPPLFPTSGPGYNLTLLQTVHFVRNSVGR